MYTAQLALQILSLLSQQARRQNCVCMVYGCERVTGIEE